MGGKVDKLRYQKLLFLLHNEQAIPSFDFVPYKYGCFSFQSYADLRTLAKYGIVRENKQGSNGSWEKLDAEDYFLQLDSSDLSAVKILKNKFGNYSASDLITLTYTKYPYYAINSTICTQYLNSKELKQIEFVRPKINDKVLFTIGYEGTSLEKYLNKLIQNDVKVLCDVRKNPLSMKYGFSKNQLKNACEGIGISYLHLPHFGIESAKRQCLETQDDYDQLFAEYKKSTLKSLNIELMDLLKLIDNNSRIALTCFEADINQCHRKYVAEQLTKLPKWNYEVRHL